MQEAALLKSSFCLSTCQPSFFPSVRSSVYCWCCLHEHLRIEDIIIGIQMGFIGLLKFAILFINFLAWPVLALGYPLFASIRAIETGSNYHMRKLVTYWIIFSLILLFEFVFAKIIEWIPFWSNIKLIAILWLVVPRFNGAYHAYRRLLRPCLLVDLQALIDRFYRVNAEKPREPVAFLNVAEKYIEENGSEALEKLVASKIQQDWKEAETSPRATHVLEPDEKNVVATSEELKEADAAMRDNGILEATEKSPSTEAKQAGSKLWGQVLHGVSNNVRWFPMEKDIGAEVKQITPPEEGERNTKPPLPKKVDREQWICPLCQVTATSETNLNAHLQGKKHKAKWESLKTSKLSSPSEGNGTAAERAEVEVPSDQQRQAKPMQGGGTIQTFWCYACGVKLLRQLDLTSHLKGKRHSSNIRMLNTAATFRCDACGVKLLSKTDLTSHLEGKRHSSNIRT